MWRLIPAASRPTPRATRWWRGSRRCAISERGTGGQCGASSRRRARRKADEGAGVSLSCERAGEAGGAMCRCKPRFTATAQSAAAAGFHDRSGQPVFAHARGLGVRVHGGAGGERRSPDCGHAGDPKCQRQRFVASAGWKTWSGACRGAAGESDRRQRVF